MELRLSLKGPERLLGGRTEASLRDGTLVVGRGPEVDWAIADPERVISKVHCRISKDFDSFQLTDLSTNGVRINETPVGYGLVRRIEDGDVIKLGDAVVTVQIAAAAAAKPARDEPPELTDDIFLDGPFGERQAESAPSNGPAGHQRQVAEPASGMVLDDWWGPVDATAPSAPAKPVDISVQPASVAIEHIHSGEETVMSADRGVASLLRMAAGSDVEMLARAVEEAATALSASERVKFEERLSEIVRSASPR